MANDQELLDPLEVNEENQELFDALGVAKQLDELAELLDDQDIVLKIHAIQEAENSCPYKAFGTRRSYWSRVRRAIEHVPYIMQPAAYSLFSSVFYITNGMRDEAQRELASSMAVEARLRGAEDLTETHVFVVDHPGLRDEFFIHGERYGWTGRLDRREEAVFQQPTMLRDAVKTRLISGQNRRDVLDEPSIAAVCDRKVWILLNDNALSGGSATSDLDKLKETLDMLDIDIRPTILVGSQIITSQALEEISSHPLIERGREDIKFGILFDNRMRINDDDCQLFSSEPMLQEVRELCQWFGKLYFPDPDVQQLPLAMMMTNDEGNRKAIADSVRGFLPTLVLHREKGGNNNFAFGWKDGGYTIVDYSKTPTNSVPMLWAPPDLDPDRSDKGLYKPPYPRSSSRIEQRPATQSKLLPAPPHNETEIK